ncbi:hypothetical protein [Halalkalibacterium halodurans]|uniref:Uncharacterized protein n=1 Tax=Halalkalibacterium halodurans TaxID=86665 RepID=A0A0M0KFB6_ALKHA|nr:hypothetical protein [Halalkalibacterium halodurans]MED4164337.1 hypothetical protein [Halalkalibacterium halodurans]
MEIYANWTFRFSFAYIIPMGILILYALIRKIKPMKSKKRWVGFIQATLFNSMLLYVLFVIFNFA